MNNKKGISSLAIALTLAVTIPLAFILIKEIRHKVASSSTAAETPTINKLLDISASAAHKPGAVVLLIGPSSAGKTTIMHELKKIYGDSYEYTSVDIFEDSYPAHDKFQEQFSSADLDQKTKDSLVETYINNLINDFYSSAKDKALNGAHVLVDTIPISDNVEKEQMQISDILKGVESVRLLLYCPLNVLTQRVEERNRSGRPEEQRHTMQAAGQFDLLFKAQDDPAQHVFDRVSTEQMKKTRKAAIQAFLDMAPPGTSKEELTRVTQKQENNFKEYVKQFKLDELPEVSIVARVPFDLALDCRHTPQELAQEIAAFLKQK